MDDAVDKAIQVCLKKLKMNPQDWNARAFLGRCYLKKGMQGEARKELEEAVKTVSNNRVVFKLLADIYEKEGRIKEAKWIYRIFSSMDIKGSETDLSLHSIKAEEPAKKEAISDVKEKKPAKITQEAKEPVTKEKTAKKEEKPKEKKKISTTTIADIYLKQGYMDRALSIYREILTKDPTNTEVQEKIDSITHKKEEYPSPKKMEPPDDLEMSLHAIKAEEPAKKEAISDVKEKKPAKITQEAKEPVTKEKTAKKEEKPKEKKKISTPAIADIYLTQGYTDKALSIYREILTKDPTNTEIQEKINSITEKKEESLPLKQMESPDDLKDIETQKEITPIAKRRKEETFPLKKVESPDDLKNKMVIATLNKWLDNLQRLEGRSI